MEWAARSLESHMPDKQRERFYLEALRRSLQEIPPGSPLEPEPPDFVLFIDRHRLGIELTTFHLPPKAGESPHQQSQSLKDQIVRLAERFHEEAGGPPLYVTIIFHEHQELRKKDVQSRARELAATMLAYPMPLPCDELPITIPFGRRPRWVAGIQANCSVDGVDKLWHADAGGWVAKITSEQVSNVVRAKASRAPRARNKCDELWLVIVNDNFSRAAQAEISREALRASYEGPFDRLIWLLPHVPRAIDLQLTRLTA
jgi:hypothetical protein